jgi:hypothetical protein
MNANVPLLEYFNSFNIFTNDLGLENVNIVLLNGFKFYLIIQTSLHTSYNPVGYLLLNTMSGVAGIVDRVWYNTLNLLRKLLLQLLWHNRFASSMGDTPPCVLACWGWVNL